MKRKGLLKAGVISECLSAFVRKEVTCLTGSSSHSLSPVVISGVTSASISRTRGEERLGGTLWESEDTKQVGDILRFD